MSLKNFLAQLSRHAARHRGWELVSDGDPCVGRIRIRMANHGIPIVQCPITAVLSLLKNKHWDARDWQDAARLLGLPLSLAGQIKNASDNRPGCSERLYLRLATAVGISLIRFEPSRSRRVA